MLTEKIIRNLEFDKITAMACEYLNLAQSRKKLIELMPCNSFSDCVEELKKTEEADKILNMYYRSPIENYDDISDIIVRAEKQSALAFIDIISIGHFLRASRLARATIVELADSSLVTFNAFASGLYEEKTFEERIGKTFLSAEEIADDASPELLSIRKRIRKLNADIKDRLASYMRSKDIQKFLQDNIVTSRNNRYVLPVKAEYKGQIQGLVHDFSASGSTIYVEPLEIVEINNDLRILYSDEIEEIAKIVAEFTKHISAIALDLKLSDEIMINADILLAKAKYCKAINAYKPILNNRGAISIVNGRHPLIAANICVPVTVKLGGEYNFLLISGPNTGGKTVTLKMTGLFSLMAMSGFFIPASEGSELSYFDSIFSDIGDEQSIEQNLSTFSSHIQTLKVIIDNVNDSSLVLLDEIGAGTDPQEGSALALSVMDYLLKCDCKGIITTHYSELKEYSYSTDKIQNASMEFNIETLEPTYKLNIGLPGSSKALEIAKRLGMKEEIISAAMGKISPLKLSFDQVISNAEKDRLVAQSKIAEYDEKIKSVDLRLAEIEKERQKLREDKESLTKVAKVEANRIVNTAKAEAEELLEEIKEIRKRSEQIGGADVIEAAKLKNKIGVIADNVEEIEVDDEFKPFDIKTAHVGDNVYVKSFSSIGSIVQINENRGKIKVLCGNLELEAKPDNLMSTPKDYKVVRQLPIKKKKDLSQKAAASVAIKNSQAMELKVIGMRVHEALPEVDKFIDAAVSSSFSTVRIIHGMGTGALRTAIWDELKTNRSVKSFRSGSFGEGDYGVTVVELNV